MCPDKREIADVVFTPVEAVSLALDSIDKRRTRVGVGARIGIGDLDGYLTPGRPGELITVLGMTSNYKSGLMQHWARFTAKEIQREEIVDECVVYVTWEQAIEEMLAFDLAYTIKLSATDVVQGRVSDDEMLRLRNEAGPRREQMPLYLIGHSISEERERPRLSLPAVTRALEYIKVEYKVKPRMIVLDYLQQIDPDEGQDRRMQVFYNVYSCKDMALQFACPVVLGVQVNRTVYKEAWAMPGVADGLESSNIEHTSDKALGVWMPKTTHDVGKELKTDSKKWGRIEVTENLLIVKVLKQKMGKAGQWWPLYVNPETNEIGPYVRDSDTTHWSG